MNEPHKWIDPPDTPPLNEKIIPGSDETNIYGPVILKRGEFRVREKDGVFAIYVGDKLVWTVRV